MLKDKYKQDRRELQRLQGILQEVRPCICPRILGIGQQMFPGFMMQ